MPKGLLESVVWRTLAWFGVEQCSVWEEGRRSFLTGCSVGIHKGAPYRARYTIQCDKSWKTQRAAVELERGDARSAVTLESGQRGWKVMGTTDSDLKRCVDVDLQFSPCTNMLPVRRLRPKVGETVRLTAAWVHFPSLKVGPLDQSYTNLGGNRYLYSSKGFKAEVEVDEIGLPIFYPGFWLREAAQQSS
jgi:hypothetical protein